MRLVSWKNTKERYVIYCALAKVALFAASERTQFSSFVHLYLVLCWNLFSRSCSVSSLRTHHCTWVNDPLVIDMSVQKGDQTACKLVFRTTMHIFKSWICFQSCALCCCCVLMWPPLIKCILLHGTELSLLGISILLAALNMWLATRLKSQESCRL